MNIFEREEGWFNDMPNDPEAVTRALHALYHRKKADRECQYANPERCRIYVEASRDASVLASLPDDRLAEAEADHNLLIEADSCLSYVRHRRASSLTDDDRREMDSLLSRLRPRTDAITRKRRSALSGGDAT